MDPGDPPAPRVLVVDDEAAITDLVGMALRYEGFRTASAATGHDALRLAEEFGPDLVVLDVLLPDLTGLEVCRRLRRTSEVPVVFLTARDATEDAVGGLTAGGDDYVTKPFSVEELVARIRAVLRRTRPGAGDGVIRYADLEIDPGAHQVSRAGRPVDLTPTEFALLRFLAVNAGRVVSKAQILTAVWRYEGGNDNVVEAYVSYLRKKVDRDDPALIHTVRGVGYTLRLPRAAAPP